MARRGSSVIRAWAIHRAREALPIALLALACVVPAAGCARNPVTGRPQMMLISEEQEFAIGEGADKEIRKEFGPYLESPSLRAYVDDVGNALARQGERTQLVFHFEVLDSPVINAFALPGGFVYVTRGMLERLSSEDELAMVLGHEIGHVTARHGAARLSALYALQYGSLLGAVISPRTVAHYGDLINLALHVGLSKYSREQESQSDALGIRYAAGAGYRPREGVTVMKILEWMEGKEPGALEKWFLSHPPAQERITDIAAHADRMESQEPHLAVRAPRREEYLKRIDGLIVGQYNGAEMVLRDRYYNKELGVGLRVPSGWEVTLEPDAALVTMSRKNEEFILLEADPMHTSVEPADMEAQFDRSLKRRGWRKTGVEQIRTGQEIVVHLARYRGRTSKGEPTGILKAFLVRSKHRYTVTAVCRLDLFEANRPIYEEILRDLRFLSESEAAALSPPRLRVIAAPAGSEWAALAQEHLGDAAQAERLAFYNGLDPAAGPEAGSLIKIPPSLAARP